MSENETLDTQETKETSQWNENAFSGEMPPSAGIREILGKTINIIDRKIFRVKFDPVKNTFDTPDSEGMITKYMVVTKQKLPITIKDKLQQVSNWYVSKGHYDQLNKLSTDGKSETLDRMFAEGKVTPNLVPCKIKGGKFGKYFSWLNPAAYEKAEKNGDLYQ